MATRSVSVAVVLLALGLTSGCYTTTRIETDPPGLDAELNGRSLGKTPVSARVSDWAGTRHYIRFKKDGRTITYPISLQKEIKWVPAITGFIALYIPWLWAYGVRSHYHFDIKPYLIEKKAMSPAESGKKTFKDTVRLRNGLVITRVRIAVTRDSVVVAYPDGRMVVLKKREVQSVERGN
jgi:hypothetical protein